MHFQIKLNTLNRNNNLHSDILISFQGIDNVEVIDSYYFFNGIFLFPKENYFEIVGFKLIERIEAWIKAIDSYHLTDDNLFVIDISDEYIGAFRFCVVEKYSYKLTYGIIRNPTSFEVKDFINKYEASLFIELYLVNSQISIQDFKENLKSCIDIVLNQIGNKNKHQFNLQKIKYNR